MDADAATVFKVGDYVVCVDPFENHLTAGKVYEVVGLNGQEFLHVIRDDTGAKGGYRSERFRLANWSDLKGKPEAEPEAENWNASDEDFLNDLILSIAAKGEEAPRPTDDIVVRPAHYTQYEIEPITFIMRNGFDFWRGNIIKYASRAGSKLYDGQDARQSEITDLRKVIRYAEMRINQLEGKETL